jgi:hypothetical protein
MDMKATKEKKPSLERQKPSQQLLRQASLLRLQRHKKGYE